MTIRPLEADDLEPLHALYASLSARIPHQPAVGFEQFANDLTAFSTPRAAGGWVEATHRNWVAVDARGPAALALCGVREPGEDGNRLEGVVRFAFAAERSEEAFRGLLRECVHELESAGAAVIEALPYHYGPRFHNTGCAMLTSVWPWLGHWLAGEGTEAASGEIAMRKPLRERPEELPLPAGCALEALDGGEYDTEFSWRRHAFVDGAMAGQCECHFAECYVRGAGRKTLYTRWLGVEEAYRGLGLGRALLRAAQVAAWDAGAEAVTLTTRDVNFRAQSLYLSEGYGTTDWMWRFRRPD